MAADGPTVFAWPTPERFEPDLGERHRPNRISSSGRDSPDRFRLDQHPWPVLAGLCRTALNCNRNCNPGGDPTFIKLVRIPPGVVDLDWGVRLIAGGGIDQMPADDGVIGSAGG
jgi:hypothetical protein